jgi:hypothetical protein
MSLERLIHVYKCMYIHVVFGLLLPYPFILFVPNLRLYLGSGHIIAIGWLLMHVGHDFRSLSKFGIYKNDCAQMCLHWVLDGRVG